MWGCFMPVDLPGPARKFRVLAAPDKFAGTLTGAEAAAAIARGWLKGRPGDEVVRRAVADGGEGMIDVVLDGIPGAIRIEEAVTGAAGEVRNAGWVLLPDGRAIVESAQACGLSSLDPSRRNPLTTTSYGVGELIKAASAHGCDHIVVGIGGTGTVDGGVGALAALSGAGAAKWRSSSLAVLQPLIHRTRLAWEGHKIELAVDVRSPLLGPEGSAYQFGPQKGATSADDLAQLENRMEEWARRVLEVRGDDGVDVSALGSGGGMAFGLAAVLGATVVSGAEMVADLIGLGREMERASVVITGEGSIDAQTTGGKAPMMVATMARAHGIPIYAIAGRAEGPTDLFDEVLTLGPAGLVRPAELVADRSYQLAMRHTATLG
jgi:glycerate kinase